jgi:acetyl-CoA carboxylase biotin carboxyl carrier protein
MKIDKSIIKELSNYLDEFNLTEIEITEKDTKIKVSKNNVSINNQPGAISSNILSGSENHSEKPNCKIWY